MRCTYEQLPRGLIDAPAKWQAGGQHGTGILGLWSAGRGCRHDVTGEQVNGTEDGANRAVQEVHQTNDREGDDHGNQL